ncbi:MAG: hypothetical protein CfP315_0074 [Candidatus Improbicoccus pseudotrichonymphae]|uniref:Uncharacterized protein n=1 Tax=Candidatus Improbicoccus pseudotrichonymphae TaxID=3033792 RepID=A0AA48L0M5_9FIRM|nr:MAG: hypothetical protein CfP315_0074 [Candidatus Improbicoccus pseudotrichonymphae]
MKKEKISNNENNKKINKNNKIISSILAVIMCCQPLVGASSNTDVKTFKAENNDRVVVASNDKVVTSVMKKKDNNNSGNNNNNNDDDDDDDEKNENTEKIPVGNMLSFLGGSAVTILTAFILNKLNIISFAPSQNWDWANSDFFTWGNVKEILRALEPNVEYFAIVANKEDEEPNIGFCNYIEIFCNSLVFQIFSRGTKKLLVFLEEISHDGKIDPGSDKGKIRLFFAMRALLIACYNISSDVINKEFATNFFSKILPNNNELFILFSSDQDISDLCRQFYNIEKPEEITLVMKIDAITWKFREKYFEKKIVFDET